MVKENGGSLDPSKAVPRGQVWEVAAGAWQLASNQKSPKQVRTGQKHPGGPIMHPGTDAIKPGVQQPAPDYPL